eukprot:9974740-Alexandrium_andersonii.AAC.1
MGAALWPKTQSHCDSRCREAAPSRPAGAPSAIVRCRASQGPIWQIATTRSLSCLCGPKRPL